MDPVRGLIFPGLGHGAVAFRYIGAHGLLQGQHGGGRDRPVSEVISGRGLTPAFSSGHPC